MPPLPASPTGLSLLSRQGPGSWGTPWVSWIEGLRTSLVLCAKFRRPPSAPSWTQPGGATRDSLTTVGGGRGGEAGVAGPQSWRGRPAPRTPLSPARQTPDAHGTIWREQEPGACGGPPRRPLASSSLSDLSPPSVQFDFGSFSRPRAQQTRRGEQETPREGSWSGQRPQGPRGAGCLAEHRVWERGWGSPPTGPSAENPMCCPSPGLTGQKSSISFFCYNTFWDKTLGKCANHCQT